MPPQDTASLQQKEKHFHLIHTKKLRDVEQKREVTIFKQVFIKQYESSLNVYKISRNMMHVMRIVQKVSHLMFAHKICLHVSGTKYPVISTCFQVSGDHPWVGGGPS